MHKSLCALLLAAVAISCGQESGTPNPLPVTPAGGTFASEPSPANVGSAGNGAPLPAHGGAAGSVSAGQPAAAGTSAPVGGVSGMASPLPAAGASSAGAPLAGGSAAGAPAGALFQCPMESCAILPPTPPDVAALGTTVMQCCASTGECGTALNGAACIATPDSHPQCPTAIIMGFEAPSCCTATGRCGLNPAAFQMPCMSIEDLNLISAGLFALPLPQACTP